MKKQETTFEAFVEIVFWFVCLIVFLIFAFLEFIISVENEYRRATKKRNKKVEEKN